MHRELFTFPVFVATVLLVVHSWLFRGPRNTFLFWGVGYLIAFMRECLYQNLYDPNYGYPGAGLRILNVPATIPFGWLFEAYISLYLAQFILRTDLPTMIAGEPRITPREYGRRVLPVIVMACAITGTIATAIEAAGMVMHWWGTGGPGYLRYGADHVDGHIYTVQWMLLLLVYVMHAPLRVKRILLNVVAAVAVELVVLGLAPRIHSGSWRPLIVGLEIVVVAAYFVSALLWKQLAIFFVVWALELNNSFPAAAVSRMFGHTDATVGIDGMIWSNVVALLYILWLARTQHPESPVRPAQLL